MQNLQENLDRLAEGELSAEETRTLFDELDKNPSQWRQCAFTLLEADQWRRAMTDLVSNDGFYSETESSEPVVLPVTLPKASTTPPTRRFASVRYWASTAAAVLIAFSLGRLLTTSPEVVSITQAVTKQDTTNQDTTNHKTEPSSTPSTRLVTSNQDVITVWTVGRNGERQSMEIPLQESEWMNEKLNQLCGPVVSEEVKKDLRKDGYQVEARRRFATLYVEGGGSFALPLNESLVSYTEPAY